MDGAQHAQRQAVDLHQAERVEIVLVPLDHGAFGHCGVFYRHQVVERFPGDQETAGVLRQVTGKSDELVGKIQGPGNDSVIRIQASLTRALWHHCSAIPPAEISR